ncbi:MAG: acyl-ACP--UDP-N-acetylglucosamine O-acyltransferase [Parvularculaceae bacterium]
MSIHSTAIVDKAAEIGEGVRIGPYCAVGASAKLGADVELVSHVVIAGDTTIGARTIVHPFAVLGGPPQHGGYKGEATRVVIGEDCLVREQATVNLGTPQGRGVTTIGDKCFMMAGSHVAHDCIVGGNVTLANNATLGGHVTIEDFVFLGGLCAIHQNCRVGAYAFIGGCAAVPADVIPYGSAIGNHARLAGLNIIGMKRRGLPRDTIHELRAAYRGLFEDEGAFQERLASVEAKLGSRPEVRRIIDFVRFDTSRALMGPR